MGAGEGYCHNQKAVDDFFPETGMHGGRGHRLSSVRAELTDVWKWQPPFLQQWHQLQNEDR